MEYNLGPRVRELREAKQWSQGKLGEAVGVPQDTISKWEQGIRDPSWNNVMRICKALGVMPNDLIYSAEGEAKAPVGRPKKNMDEETPKRKRGRPKKE